MRLKNLKVSNILSYEFLSDFENSPYTIEFKDDLNILIGSNGSGKSNLLEIVYKLLQGHFFRSYYMNDNAIFNVDPKVKDRTIAINDERLRQISNTLFGNFTSRNKQSTFEVEIAADPGDIKNLIFIYKHWKELNELAKQYTRDLSFFSHQLTFPVEEIECFKSCKYFFELNNKGEGQISISIQKQPQGIELLFYNYLLFFNQLQTLLELSNLYLGKAYTLLKNSFALISSMRTYGGFFNSITMTTGLNEQVKQAEQQEGTHSTKAYSQTDYIFRITSLRLSQELRRLRNLIGTDAALKAMFKSNSLLSRINTLLKLYLGFDLKLEDFNESTDSVKLAIRNGGEEINFSELSMGQKSIFYLLFAVYGYNLKDGLLIIDEPELHLHVTMQQKYFDIIEKIRQESNLQIIIATHSSVFVNEKSIKNTFRFSKNGNHTSIVSPKQINQSQKDLVKILTYTNSSRIFFSDDVLLVEGDSDEYFFRYFYEKHFKPKFPTDKSIEIVYIGGKGNYAKWKEFLDLFKINTYFLGDFDNIKEYNVAHKAGVNLEDLKEKAKEQVIAEITKKRIGTETKDGKALLRHLDKVVNNNFTIEDDDKENLQSLWMYLLEKQGFNSDYILSYLTKENPEAYGKIKSEIESLYDRDVFILKQGVLENYLGISKDLENVIKFCEISFETWIENEAKKGSASKLTEIEEIFKRILS